MNETNLPTADKTNADFTAPTACRVSGHKSWTQNSNGAFLVKFFIKESTRLKIQLFDAGGKLLEEETLQNINVGEHSFEKSVAQLERGGTYFLRVETAYESISQKVIIKR